MVFESLVVDLINKYLGDFVENLDSSQLKIGIWGGDVVLNELDLKESALDDLDLPVKIKAGHVGKLTLKIPWKNLYTEPVIATIDGLYALAVPNVGIKYNAEKDEKEKQAAKQKKLLALEEAKKLEAEKDKPKEKKKDSFAEKFATQVIKNLQIEIRNIHVRYEDRYTNPKQPFSIGVTLGELLFRTTDENWKPCIIKEAVSQIYKLVKLEALAVYWNSNSKIYDGMDKADVLKTLKSEITEGQKVGFQYLIRPISSVAHLRLNTKPDETEYKVPKIFLTIIFDEISVGLAKVQYNDVLEMLEGFERVYLMGIYKKYKPSVPFRGNIRTWWHYAYTSILEETVRRRRKMWSWDHIQQHRTMKHKYREAYIQKLESKKVSGDLQKQLDECEHYLDVFNITVMRQQAEVEAAKRGAKRAEDKKNSGWFGGWFGGGKKKDEKGKAKEEKGIEDQFYEQFNAEEKQKLYDAIGYQENEADPTLPKEFVAVRLVTKLNNLSLTLKDDKKKDPQILKLQLKNVFASVGQRPAASAINVEAKMDKFTLLGTQQEDFIPRMITSQTEMAQQVLSLIDVLFETNPLDQSCDARVRVNARPLQIIYDAITVNQMVEFFKPPQDIQLKQLSQAAMSKYEQIKEQSATGLQHAIEQKKYTEIAVDLKSSYVIVPHGGILRKQKEVSKLVLDLGNLSIGSQKSQTTEGQLGSLDEVMLKAYDTFNIKLERIQLLMAHAGEDWQNARIIGDSPMHILRPISINICLQKCMFDNDPRMAKMKVQGEMPLISLNISDHRLQEILSMVQSIPLPETGGEEPEDIFADAPSALPMVDMVESHMAQKAQSIVGTEVKKEEKAVVRADSQDVTNMTDIELSFVINEININIAQRVDKVDVPLLKLVIEKLGTSVKIRTFDMLADAYLGGIYLQYLRLKIPDSMASQLSSTVYKVTDSGPLINLVNTPALDDSNYQLLTVSYVKANKDSPEYVPVHKKTEQSVCVKFSALEVLLHQEAILNLLQFAQSLQPPEIKPSETKVSESKTGEAEKGKVAKTAKKKKLKDLDPEEINIKVNASLEMFAVCVCSPEKVITDVKIRGIDTIVTLQEDKIVVSALLKNISIRDPDQLSLYPNILDTQAKEVLKFDLTLFNDNTEGERYSDMSAVDIKVGVVLGQIRVVFVNKFVTDMLGFLNNFQAAQAKLKEASDAMAEITQDAVQNIQEKASRISLSVNLDAPYIIVPQNSKSYNVLVVDFGHLELGNKFELAGKSSANGIPAILNKIGLTLSDLKVSRAIVDASQFVKTEVEILEPVTVKVNLCQNMAAGWFHDVPEIDIAGTLPSISVSLSQGDFTALMKVLNENLTEGQAPSPAQEVKALPSTTSEVEAAVVPSRASAIESTPQAQQTGAGDKAWCKMKFEFRMNQLTATLYSGDSKLSEGLIKRDIAKALGSFELQLIALEGHMMSNNDLDTKVILKDTIMDDMRPLKKDGINRMMERSKKSGGDKNMIDVSFKQENKDKNVEVHMSSLYVCVCLDFLMSLADFFVKGLPPPPETTPPPVVAVEEKAKATKSKESVEVPPAEGEMSVLVTIDKPEIILIEDQSNFCSNALILDTELMFRLRQTPETMDMSANIKGLGIVSCQYDNRSSAAQILSPCDISFYGKTPKGQGAHMDISTSDLILNISPATIRTMSGIAAGLSKQEEEGEEEVKVPGDLWEIKKLKDCDFWFLKNAESDPDSKVVEDPLPIGSSVDESLEVRGEQELVIPDRQMIVRVPTIVVKLEGGVGRRTVPLLITEMTFEGEVRDWSGKLSVESRLKLEIAYYNEMLSVWEPLLEPVPDNGKYKRWELQLEVTKNEDVDLDIDDDDTDSVKIPPPKMTINVKSIDPLQVTMTKACLEVLTNLGKAFGDAYQLVPPSQKAGEVIAPYMVYNTTGLDLTLKLDSAFEMPSDADSGRVRLLTGVTLPLQERKGPVMKKQISIIKAAQETDEKKIIFQVDKFNAIRELIIKRAEKRLFHVNNKTYPGDVWSVLCDTESHAGFKNITFRSSVQVCNHLLVPVEVFYNDDDKGVTLVATLKSEESLDMPCSAIYTATGAFKFRPLKDGYVGMSEDVSWKGAENLGVKQLSSKGKEGQAAFFFNVRADIEDVYYEAGDDKSAKCTTFHLHPTAFLHNLLPYPVQVMLEGTEGSFGLERGENTAVDNADIGKSNVEITLPDYLGTEWVGRRLLDKKIPELSVWSFETIRDGTKVTMDLGLHFKHSVGTLDVSLYCPYWMINKTDIRLLYKAGDGGDVIEHPANLTDIVMFSFKKKSDKQKASLKIADADWSDKFSLDTVGSSGTVQSKMKSRTYEVGVSITLSSSGLTKIVTITPYFMLVNSSPYTMLCKEVAETSGWIEVPPKQCVPHWPIHYNKDMVMQAKIKDTEVATGHFYFNKNHSTLLRLDNEYGGISVECQETEAAMVTTLTHYKDGMAAVLIINHTERCDLNFNQSGVKTQHILKPEMVMLYSWENTLEKRDLVWTCGKQKGVKNDLSQDGIGEFFYDTDTKVYWVSFLNGMQRVLLFTHDLALATIAQEAGELERIEQEINLSIQGMGLSLVNNYKQQEVAFLGITSSGIIWEEKRKRYKALNVKTCIALEEAYQKFQTEILKGHTPPTKMHVDKMEVNFAEMLMTKPNKRMIRRSFEDGIWVQYKTSPHQVQLHAKINRVQLDQQVSGAVFPTILSPMPPPKSVAADSVPKPFTEVSMMMRKHEHSNVSQIKYFKVLVQEMQVKVDQGFLNNIIELFSSGEESSREQEKDLFETDFKSTQVDLMEACGLSLAVEQKQFYDYLHLSPIKVHLSFSLQGGGGDGKPTQIHANVLNIFLQSVGVVLTDIQDVIFKLGFFEREHNFYNNKQLQSEMTRHYAGQAIKQMYVLVLGLDVLGNPFGLLRGMATGIEDLFYEPYQGAIQGPEEFAEGLALGVRSLFGHAVGGAAGAVSRITGTLGKGIAALTLDDEYQKKRQEALNKRPANVGEGFARGGKGLVMGVFDGVTGIVRKPVEGAKEEGAKGFFKGVGKGLVGVVTRPTSGVIDFASSSFEGIKRIAENTTEIHRLRPPRRFYKDQIMRPYNVLEAEGCAILMETEKGKFIPTDDYIAHVVVTKDNKNVFLVTDKRILFSSRGEIFGQWNVEFTHTWVELKEKPKLSPKGIEISLKEKEKKKFLFGSSTAKKEIHISDKKTAEWLVGKISDAMDNA